MHHVPPRIELMNRNAYLDRLAKEHVDGRFGPDAKDEPDLLVSNSLSANVFI